MATGTIMVVCWAIDFLDAFPEKISDVFKTRNFLL